MNARIYLMDKMGPLVRGRYIFMFVLSYIVLSTPIVWADDVTQIMNNTIIPVQLYNEALLTDILLYLSEASQIYGPDDNRMDVCILYDPSIGERVDEATVLPRITFAATNMSLMQTINKLCADLSLTYEIYRDTIILRNAGDDGKPYPKSDTEYIDDNIYEVYSAAINSIRSRFREGDYLLISDKTDTNAVLSMLTYTKGSTGPINQDTYNDYMANNNSSISISNGFTVSMPIHVIGVSDEYAFLNDSASQDSVFSNAMGYVKLSAVGFSATGREALMSLSYYKSAYTAAGMVFVLRYTPAGWVVYRKELMWIT